MLRRTIRVTYKVARRIAVGVVGTTVVLLGVALLILPGPALIVIPAGLAILALEFAWARRWLRIARERSQQALELIGVGKRARTQSRKLSSS
ncbi:MAG: PGPGW domain-containing protein [Myxococcales bacterium]|nr:PGPGW domain-containing protein [Myxococcales bacterium]